MSVRQNKQSYQEMELSEGQRAAIEAMTEEGDIYGRLASSIAPGAPRALLRPSPVLAAWLAGRLAGWLLRACWNCSITTHRNNIRHPTPAEIYGHEDVKKALLLAMVRGSS